MQMKILNANALDNSNACSLVERGEELTATTKSSRQQGKPQVMKSYERTGECKKKNSRRKHKHNVGKGTKLTETKGINGDGQGYDWHSNWNCSYGNNKQKNNNNVINNNSKLSRHEVCAKESATIATLLLCYYCYLLLLGHLPAVSAHCRDEESRACEAICSVRQGDNSNNNGIKNCTIRALVLLPDDDMYVASLSRVMPILKVAEQQIRAHALIPPHIDFEWLARNEKCDASLAMIKAMDGITKNCAHVIFGPVCDYSLAAVSRITKYFNSQGTPLISVGGSTYDFEQKKTTCNDEFYMLLRTGMLSFETLSELTINVMKRHNWSHSIFYYERDGQKSVAGMHTCFLMMKSLGKQMRKENMTFAQYPLDPKLVNRTDEMKREIGNKHSIVIMCADPQSIRQIMLTAEELKMIDSGEYVFINIELFSRVPYLTSQPWYDKNDTAMNNERARKAYTAMLTVTPKQPNDDAYTRVSNDIKAIAAAKYNYTFSDNEPISAFVTSFFDGVLLYANALNDSIREDPTMLDRPINGTDMVRRMWNRSFTGITGNVTIDANGDRISAYSLLDMNPNTGSFEIVAHFLHNRLDYEPDKVIHWAGDREEAPPDMPTCGYDGALCPDNSLPGYAILSIVLGMIVIVMAVCFFFGYRHYKSEAEINSMTWKIAIDEVVFRDATDRYMRGSFHSLVKQSSQLTLMSEDMGSINGDRQIFIPVGMYRGCKVAIKTIDEESINLTRDLMLELKRMKDLQHDHLVKFYGACLDTRKSFLLTEYCPKGSLQDILENEQFQLDWMFKLSLMHDIVRGMHFLHNSDIRSHGNLKSSNCVVDSRFVLKITDFGLHTLRRGARYDKESDVENCNSHAYWSQFLWTAPELLKMEYNRPPEGTQKGDIYSFAIIVHEITTRQGPFYLGKNEKSPQEIIELVKGYPDLTPTPFRPEIEDMPNDINSIMSRCWAEEPAERLDFTTLKTIIRKINKDNETGNIVDNLLKRMEMYANNLEELVEERTQDYNEEKKKCEKLLYQLLPQSVAAQLISGRPVVAETFDQVTIYFSDIVGFTAISAESTPMQVVQFLNDLYTCFDSIVENFDVYKVETIGDAYMVVSGLPIRNGNQHAREIARLALALLEAVHNFCIHHRPNDRLKLRIGLHTGACVAGVVGLKMPRYCLFGDTVNTASRMESNGEALKIHISETTKMALDEFGTFVTTRRGYVPMKGKGEMLTYWLEGEMHKADEHLSPHKLMLTRRSSLKQPSKYAPLQKQYSELITLNALVAGLGQDKRLPQINVPSIATPNGDNGNVDMGIDADEQHQHQQQQQLQQTTSPTLRVKRKISSSSPKLNGGFGGDNKTDEYNYYMDAYGGIGNGSGILDKTKYKLQQCDIYSSRSLRESSQRSNDNWELANFRLPLSGALKSHNIHNNHNNNNRHSYIQSNSNTNLSGILQPTTRIRLKQSPTISTLVTSGTDNVSVCSGNRIKFAGEPPIESTANTATMPLNCSSKVPLLENNTIPNTNSNPVVLAANQTHTVAHSPTHKLSRHNTAAGTLVSSSDNHHSFNNLIKANNVKNYTQLLCKTSSNSMMTLAEECPNARNGGSGAGAVVVANSAVTQPLLAKINS